MLWAAGGVVVGVVYTFLLVNFLFTVVSTSGDFVPSGIRTFLWFGGVVSVGVVAALRYLIPDISTSKWIIGLILWFIMLACVFSYSVWPRPHLRAGCEVRKRDILMMNNESFELHNCVVRIGVGGGQWQIRLMSVPANGSVSIPYSAFNPVSFDNRNLRLADRDHLIREWIDPLVLTCREGRWHGCLMCT